MGRIIDVLDGAVARATGQTSDLGAGVDAGIDKAATAKLLCDLTRKDAAPKLVIGTIALLNTINAAATGITNMRKEEKDFQIGRPSLESSPWQVKQLHYSPMRAPIPPNITGAQD